MINNYKPTQMKKYLMFMLVFVMGIGMVNAHPVDQSRAKYVGQQFVQTSFDQLKANSNLNLVYTAVATRGAVAYYVFNVGTEGFVIVSGNDFYRPIIGFSEEGTFDAENINPELGFMLNRLAEKMGAVNSGKASPAIEAEWECLMNGNMLPSRNSKKARTYLVQTKWNQDYPYNALCPTGVGGPGGRVYAGCVASAMSQVMKFWDHPTQGQGSHTNVHGGSANFGNTTYDWPNMPLSLTSGSSQAEINAVATLMYHCAVSVDMNWAIDGSGAFSADVPGRIIQYFRYSNAATLQYRDSYTRSAWADKLKESFDMGWPVYYSGQDVSVTPSAGHAFVCDGYDDDGFFHYNWGWSGSGDGWFDFDEIDYNSSDGAIFNFVPTEVYNAAPQAPTSFIVSPVANYELAADLTWINPSKTLNNSNLTQIDQIVVERNGEVIYTENNVTPGAIMHYTDNTVPCFDYFDYQVYAISNGVHGKIGYKNGVAFGPTCDWTLMMTSNVIQGWRDGSLSVYNASGSLVGTYSASSSGTSTATIHMPLGINTIVWTTPSTPVTSINIIIKDSQNTTVYNYSGSSADLASGVIFEGNNGCGETPVSSQVLNLNASVDPDNVNNIVLNWDDLGEEGYGYVVYRDELLYRLIPTGHSFVDENVSIGGHCYYVGFLGYGGDNGLYSNESCANAGEGCESPTDLDYETTGSQFKTKLKWTRPNPGEGLTGYYLYRKAEGEDYKRIKLVGPTATTYTDNTALEEGDYYYKLVAYYQGTECVSAPANWIGDENQYFLHVYYSPTGVSENESASVALYPNPANNQFTIEGLGLTHVAVYNMVGQLVYDTDCEGNTKVVNLNGVQSGIYMVRINTTEGNTTKRVTIMR